MVDFPIHKHGNILDLIITELAADVQIKNVLCGPYLSDHCIITCTFNLPKTKINAKSKNTEISRKQILWK